MSLTTIMWIVCGVIYAFLIVGVIVLVVINRIRNRKGRDE